MSIKIAVVSAVDVRFMLLLRDMLRSAGPAMAARHVDFACFDIGLDAPSRAELHAAGTTILRPRSHFGLAADEHEPALLSFVARPFLPEYLPGYDVYVWIDSDVWLQHGSVLDDYIEAAQRTGFAITHEAERAYRIQPWLTGWTAKHFLLGYGPVQGAALLARRHLNAGFFAGSADAPHWAAWAACYRGAIARSGKLVPHDQFALNQALHAPGINRQRLEATILPPTHNWICDRGLPMWSDAEGVFCKPYPPYQPIGALHLAGPAKHRTYRIRRTGGGSFTSYLVHGARPDAPVLVAPLARLLTAA